MHKIINITTYFIAQIIINLAIAPLIDRLYILGLITHILLFIIVYLRTPGYLKTILANSQINSPDSKNQIIEKAQTKQRTKVLQSSLIIHKKKGLQSNFKENSSRTELVLAEKPIDIPIKEIIDQGEVVYLEQLYCVKCLLDQPIRVKHCNSCKLCIRTYDHHDFLFNTCIGEKNKIYFVLFLIFQAGQIVRVMDYAIKLYTTYYMLSIVTPLLCVGFYVVFQIAYQLYLICTNQTMAEHLNPEQLPYLKYAQDNVSKPFSTTVLGNIRAFLQSSCNNKPHVWTIEYIIQQ